MTSMKLEPAAPRSRVKHSTTEPVRCKSDMEFRYQTIVLTIQFRKRVAKFMIPIILFKKFLS